MSHPTELRMDHRDLLSALTTEAVNERTANIDLASTSDLVQMLHTEDRRAVEAVEMVLPEVTQAVDMLVDTITGGRRMVYVGAGTSGRLGILDASEMPPTYGLDPSLIGGLIAGGRDAVFQSVEGAEDSGSDGAAAVMAYQEGDPRPLGMVVGLSASGRTPFVIGALRAASERGMRTVLVSTNAIETVKTIAPFVDLLICPPVGPEPIAGSTRMKSGTAQKLILNMITTGAMIRLGKTFGNVMVDLRATNHKLRMRAIRTVGKVCGIDDTRAEQLLDGSSWNVKVAIVMGVRGLEADAATALLASVDGRIRKAIEHTS